MKTYLTYGVGMTFASAVVTLVLHIMGYWSDPEKLGTALMIAFPVGLLITTGGIVLGTKEARAPHGAKGFTYGQAWQAGFFVILFAALSGVIFNAIYFGVINPNFNEVTMDWTKSFMERMGAPEAQIDKKIEEMRTTNTVLRQVINGFVGAVVLGAIISLITAAVMKRAPVEDFSEAPPPLS